ncbi:MAG TPA: hypothetical protein VJY62_09580 [Bacteroidia bacterium]|nr:hypothetical protein [Bacteroidia bacterium]
MHSQQFLIGEAKSLLTRLNLLKPFALTMPMVNAANVTNEALKEITNLLLAGNKELKLRVHRFILRLKNEHNISPEDAQSHYAILKLRFNALLDSLDIFADVLSQRAEHDTGVWVAGLDVLATEALNLKGNYYTSPPLVCFLERGHGAAIRKARTRLPGGELNPVAVIQVPRERMVSSGIASSLIHEVGHQGAALLNLIESLREAIKHKQQDGSFPTAWKLYNRWISEIIADYWAMAHLGIGATLGLINVVSLPRYFMFRIKLDDPHPFPWIRVKLSLAFGKAFYPDPQWEHLEQLWAAMYPLEKLDLNSKQIINELEECMPDFVQLLMQHQTKNTRQKPLCEIFPYRNRQPEMLRQLYAQWREHPSAINHASPVLLFAVIGQAHSDGSIGADEESQVLSQYLTQWALLRSESRSLKQNNNTIKQIQELIN